MSEPTPTPTPTPAPTGRPIRDAVGRWLADKPWWVKAIVAGLFVTLGAVVQHYRQPEPTPQPPPPAPVVNVTLPPVVQQPAIEAAVAAERVAGQRLFGRLIRERVSKQLQTDGFKLAGGDPTPLTKAKADELVRRLDDEVVSGVYGEVSGDGPDVARGPVIDFFKRIVEWIRTHPEEFKRIISFLLTILMMFLGDAPA